MMQPNRRRIVRAGSVAALAVCLASPTLGGIVPKTVALAEGVWTSIGGELPGTDLPISGVVFGERGELWVHGAFEQAGNSAAHHLAHWDGNHWGSVGAGIPRLNSWTDDINVSILERDLDGRLLVGGTYGLGANIPFLLRWDGSRWDTLTGRIFCEGLMQKCVMGEVAVSPTSGELHLSGIFRIPGDKANREHVVRWTGNGWTPVDTGLTIAPRHLEFDGEGRLLAAGYGVMRRENGVWSYLGHDSATSGSADVLALARDSTGAPIVAGLQLRGLGDSAIVARWDGSAWRGLGNRQLGAPIRDDWARDIQSLVVDDSGRILLSGYLRLPSPLDTAHIVRWNGSQWEAWSSAYGRIVTGPSGRVAIFGRISRVGDLPVSHVALRENGTWKALGDGIAGTVMSIATDRDGSLIVGGRFHGVNGVLASNIVRWDHGNWKPLGAGTDGAVKTIAIDSSGMIYAGGSFHQAGSTDTCNHIARWNGFSWSALGDGFDDDVEELVVDKNGSLIAGGWFQYSRWQAVNGLARWNGTRWIRMVPDSGSSADLCVVALSQDASGRLLIGGRRGDSHRGPGVVIAYSDTAGIIWHDGVEFGDIGQINAILSLPSGAFVFSGSIHGQQHLAFANYAQSQWIDSVFESAKATALHDGGMNGIFLGGTFQWDRWIGSIARWQGDTMTVFRGLTGDVQTISADSEGRILVGGLFRGKGGSGLARLENPTATSLDPPVRKPIRASAFRTTGAGLTTARPGHLEILDLSGRRLFSSEVGVGFNLSSVSIGTGVRIARLGGESVRFLCPGGR